MYRIQAYNIVSKHFEIIKTKSMSEKMKIIKDLEANPDYGLVTVEWLARY